MMISQFSEGQAMDMGIMTAAVQQAETARLEKACGCEHENHFDAKREASGEHEYLAVPAGARSALYVGKICDHCAETCMVNYLI